MVTHFKNLAANAARFLNCVDHFGTLCIKGLRLIYSIKKDTSFQVEISQGLKRISNK